MTLNIMVLTPIVIYQSANFRLTSLDTGKPFSDPSPKTVTLTYFAWEGFVTYTGIGQWYRRDVSNYLTGWLTGLESPSMAEVAAVIENKGTTFLRSVERRTSRRTKHTFTLAGFVDGFPHAYVISNHEDCFGTGRSIADDHLATTARSLGYAEKAVVIVTGYKPAVSRAERRTLGAVATKYPGDALRIRRRIANLNADAARRSKGMVSEECVVLSFRSDGTGAMLLSGESDQVPRQLPHITNGIDTNKMLSDALKNAGIDISNSRIVQAAYASARPGNSVAGQKIECRYAIRSPEANGAYTATEIKSSEFELIGARAISDCGQIVGTGREGLRTDQPQNIPWSCSDGKLTRLSYLGLATAVNNEGHVAAVLQGASAPPPSWQRAASYADGRLVELPLYHDQSESSARSDSEVGAINSSSLMAGGVAVQYEKDGPLHKFAAVFSIGQPITIFGGLNPKPECRALRINDQGHVLLLMEIRPFDVRSVLWNPADGSWHCVSGDTANVFPIALNDHDVVLGQARNEQNDPVAVLCLPGGGWERLGTPDKWAPIDMNNECQVVGRTMVDLLERPWLHEPDGRTVMLPYLTDHHSGPASINNCGMIAGGASTDRCHHVLLWDTDQVDARPSR